jgi:hypothetical protein
MARSEVLGKSVTSLLAAERLFPMNQKTIFSGEWRLTDGVRQRVKSVRKVEDFSNIIGGPSRAVLLVPAKSNRALGNAGASKAGIRPRSAGRYAPKLLCRRELCRTPPAKEKCLTRRASKTTWLGTCGDKQSGMSAVVVVRGLASSKPLGRLTIFASRLYDEGRELSFLGI